jgi:hypothetical protein
LAILANQRRRLQRFEAVVAQLPAAATAMCLVTVVISIAVAGCGGTIQRDQLPGRYRVDYGYGIEQLTIRGDGTYTQEFAAKGTDLRVINNGHWELEHGSFWDGELLDLFEPSIVDEFGRPRDMTPQSGRWPIPIRKSWRGQLRLVINEDVGDVFERVR